MPITTGSRQAAVPVLERHMLKTAATTIMHSIKFFWLLPARLTINTPMLCASPVWNIAAPTTNIPANSVTVGCESPKNTPLSGI